MWPEPVKVEFNVGNFFADYVLAWAEAGHVQIP
jgi:hypothetical protein